MSEQGGDDPESMGTVVIAGLANLAIAVAKAVAGVLSGSAAMLSEAAHSLADTVTEVLLFVALRRGAQPADEKHPFGHGKASYVWALLAACATLTLGAGFAIFQGIHTIVSHKESGDYLLSYIVLVISFAIEATSLTRAVSQLRSGARRWRIPALRYLRRTPDTTVKAVTLEDSAALVGLLIAAVGLGLSEITGSPMWDGVASVAIGVLLVVIALTLVRSNVSLIVGEAPPMGLQDAIRDELEQSPHFHRVLEMLTMYLGPQSLLVAAKVDFADSSITELAIASDDAERRLRERFPLITHVFLDPTPGARSGPEAASIQPVPFEGEPETL